MPDRLRGTQHSVGDALRPPAAGKSSSEWGKCCDEATHRAKAIYTLRERYVVSRKARPMAQYVDEGGVIGRNWVLHLELGKDIAQLGRPFHGVGRVRDDEANRCSGKRFGVAADRKQCLRNTRMSFVWL